MRTLAISITTHNRSQDLARTLLQLRKLNPQPNEIIVGADNCSDDTEQMVARNFPEVNFISSKEQPLGSVGMRDRIIRTAKSDLILSLDDDSYPHEEDFVARVQSLFDTYPDLGLLTFPQITDEFPETTSLSQNFGPSQYVSSYPNSGALFLREQYLQLPGYPLFFFHAYEEPDYALQLWSAGKQVICYTGLRIRHHWTPNQRNECRTHQRHARNEALSIVLRAPWWLAPPLLLWRAIRQAMYAAKRGPQWLIEEPKWWGEFCKLLPQALSQRKAIPIKPYWAWLKRLGKPQKLDC